MSLYYKSDCKAWATKAFQSARFGAGGKMVTITPKSGRVLGGVKVPDGKFAYPNWFHHYAVQWGGKWYDEAYPEGLPIASFKARFLHSDMIRFDVAP